MPLIYIEKYEDKWIMNTDDTTGKRLVFTFEFTPNNWFENEHKRFIEENLKLKTLTVNTLNRYNYSMRHFYQFIDEQELPIYKFEDLTYFDIQAYLNYLLGRGLSHSTMSTSMSALKRIIRHGIDFEYEGYPKTEIFDGKEHSRIGQEDILKTNYISDELMAKIESSLKDEKNIYIKSILEILIDTGARISEVLDLKVDSLKEDFSGKPILEIYSAKNNSERFIPVSRRVYWAVKKIADHTELYRAVLNTDYIFLYRNRNNEVRRIVQKRCRDLLNSFLDRHKIKNHYKAGDHITFHSFRHTLGTQMLNNGMSIFEIQDYLGHNSTHSTSLYAKVKNPKVQNEYKRAGFIGLIKKNKKEIEEIKNKNNSTTDIKTAALPDGVCGQPIDNKGNICAKFNACVICPKFITTPEHLPSHKNHLERLQRDKEEYMKTEYIGTQEHLEKVEFALVTIIERLEDIQNGSKEAN